MNERTNNPRRGNEAGEIITSGGIWHAVWYLAWPTAVNTLILTAYNIVNRIFLGRLGAEAPSSLAAVGIGGTVLMIQFALPLGLSIGTSALVSRFIGARNYEDAGEATRQSIILSVITGILATVPLVVFQTPIVRAVGAQGPVIALAADYLAITAYFSVPMFLYTIITAALRSAGDVRTPLYVGAVVILVNAVFDYLLIFGVGPFPHLGVRGAAISTGISRIVGVVLILWPLRRSALGGSLDHMRARKEWFGRILKIGWVGTVQNLLWTTAFAGFIRILAFLPNATEAQAALTVAIAVESLAFMPGVAFSIAATPLVGQNLGAGKPERAEHAAWVATWQAAGIMSIVALAFLIVPGPLAHVFTDKASIVPLIVWYLRINAISEPFLAIGMVLRGGLQGAGDVVVPAAISLLTLWIIRLPIAYLLAVHLRYGAAGAWIAMSFTTLLSGVLTMVWFKWGSWRTRQV